VRAYGSYKNSRCGAFSGTLPDSPRLDELIRLPREIDAMSQKPLPIGMPSFNFKAD
jgi:hypothetical protein